MGDCLSACLKDRDGASDPMLDQEARARAAEAAQARQTAHDNSPAAKQAAKARQREAAASRKFRVHEKKLLLPEVRQLLLF